MSEKLKYVEPETYITKSMMEILKRGEKSASEHSENQSSEKTDDSKSSNKGEKP